MGSGGYCRDFRGEIFVGIGDMRRAYRTAETVRWEETVRMEATAVQGIMLQRTSRVLECIWAELWRAAKNTACCHFSNN